jgi:hypothetical protein
MITNRFIEGFNKKITVEGLNLITEFFIIFSRFEYALKKSNFANYNNNGPVLANWDGFVTSIAPSFNYEKNDELKDAVKYLMQYPPRMQVIDNGQLSWRERVFQTNVPSINKLCLSIRDIRNNLFHGGKFNGRYERDVSRNYLLLKSSITVLNDWLGLNKNVRDEFFAAL